MLLAGFALVWNIIAVAVSTVFLTAISKPFPHAGYMVLLFPAFGLGISWVAAREFLDWRRFGRLKLTLDPYPGAIGGEIGGWLYVPVRPNKLGPLKASIVCSRKTTALSGNKGSSSETTLWDQAATTRVEMSAHGSRISFLTQTRARLPDAEPGSGSHHWRLHLNATHSRLNCRFDLPVFANGGRRTSRLPIEPAALLVKPEQFPTEIVQVQRQAAGLELYYPSSRGGSFATPFMLIGLVFAAIGAGLGFAAGATASAVMFTPLGLLLFLIGLNQKLSTLRILIGPDTVSCLSSTGPFQRRKSAPTVRLGKPWKVISMHSRDQTGTTAYYRIQASTAKQTLTLGDSIPGESLTNGLLKLIEDELNKSARE